MTRSPDKGAVPAADRALHLCLLLPHLRLGGIETGLTKLREPLLGRGWRITFIVQSRTGELLERMDPGQPLLDLGGRRFPGAVATMAGLLRKHEFDLIYSATNVTNLIALLALRLSARRDRVASIISEHTPLEAFLGSAKMRGLRVAAMRALYPSASALCAPTPEIGEEHRLRLGPGCPSFHVLPNPVIAALAPMQPVAPQADRLVAIGRLSPEKRFDLAIRAFARLHEQRTSARLTIYGEGPERARLEALRNSLDLEEAVDLPGATTDVERALAEADGFLCTSAREGLGNAIIEAQAAGVPVLSVDCPFGPRHLLRDGAAGCLVPDTGLPALESALIRFHGDAAARSAWRGAARDVATSYTIDRAGDEHDRVFRQVIAEHDKRRRA